MGAQLESNGNILWGVLEPGKAETKDLPLPLVVSQASPLELHNRSETEAKAIQYAEGRLGLTSKTVWLYFYKSKPVYGPLLESLADMGFPFDVDKGAGGVGVAAGFNISARSDSAAEATATRSTLLSFSYDWR